MVEALSPARGPRSERQNNEAEEEALLQHDEDLISQRGDEHGFTRSDKSNLSSTLSSFSLRQRPGVVPTFEIAEPSQTLKHGRRNTYCSLCINCCFFSFAAIGFISFIGIFFGAFFYRPKPFWPTWGQSGSFTEGLKHYPTDFTRDIQPVKCHSHNDYWRRIPLFEAVHEGCIGVEADVWLYNGDLFVGHSESSLTINRTFQNLYVKPLLYILEHQNPSNSFGTATKNGVFDVDASQSLILLIDIKTESNVTFPEVESQLQSLNEAGYLTYFDGEKVIPGPITVVGTGNTAFSMILEQKDRYIFFDAPLQELNEGSETLKSNKYNETNSYYASASLYENIGFPWFGSYSSDQKAKMKSLIDGAHQAGLQARFWETPGFPIGLRNHVWSLLIHLGADMLNVDDIYAATHGTWGTWG